ncbi:MAG: hypothetical protein IT243_05380 [Bacteroidia bacterium]|nr:hypothetical protein [Bacteroidia bacterium]
MKSCFLIFSLIFVSKISVSQDLFKREFEKKKLIIIDLCYKQQFPGFDLVKRFGTNSSIGSEIFYKTKNNWMIGLGGNFIWGKNVKETGILDSIKSKTGEIIDQNGQFSVIGFEQRGMSFNISAGKIFSLNKNKNSGLQLLFGGGFIQHHIRIYAPETVPQLNEEMKKGYDRLTNGPSISQYVGYRFLDPKKRLNFSLGIELIEGFTQNRRSFNYDTRMKDPKKRFDLLTGLKFSLSIPIYLKKAEEEEFYE